ncbi:pilus assembly protein PilP [Acinetobacter qingfengensis]|uniref:Pilus assembly protein PilP n=1 Tax=Acinetobacter qingfengensis TaxID=1262585 RepID=A0A1E7R190_9GAMM|nr:pilus assembly protein PilP [Acinetobacter qingfengensis]KAA8733295.1 pilus assembly protein PilP [Acinetobacter qingfengensis]OEY93073.1 pilus assembly protein PilP [Acinetobacter qingfengensis]
MRKNSQGAICLLTLLTIALVGCKSKVDDVQAKMQEIRDKPPLAVTPPPAFNPIPNYTYDAYQLKSPFVPTSIANELKVMAGKRVYPNLARPSQPLENYALEELLMKGTMRNSAGKTIALVRTPDGQIEQVQAGNYMGKNYGRVIRISPNQIDLLEVVPDGQDGYIERPRTLLLRTDIQ